MSHTSAEDLGTKQIRISQGPIILLPEKSKGTLCLFIHNTMKTWHRYNQQTTSPKKEIVGKKERVDSYGQLIMFILVSACIGQRRRTTVDNVSTRATMAADVGRCPTLLV